VKLFGIKTTRELAESGIQGDLVLGNNFLAQAADLNSFVEGIRVILKPNGVCTTEFPHLLRTLAGNRIDRIYHEHFSYFGARTAEKIFAAHGMRIFDIEEVWTHGSLSRIYASHASDETHSTLPAVPSPLCRLAGTHMPILSGEKIARTETDGAPILPWNLKDDVMTERPAPREPGVRIVMAMPEVTVI
jgi:hypothetical protein